eukprot:1155948-Pelagomonas_calceolata.AAC.3
MHMPAQVQTAPAACRPPRTPLQESSPSVGWGAGRAAPPSFVAPAGRPGVWWPARGVRHGGGAAGTGAAAALVAAVKAAAAGAAPLHGSCRQGRMLPRAPSGEAHGDQALALVAPEGAYGLGLLGPARGSERQEGGYRG